MDQHLALHRARVPGEIKIPGAALALGKHAPFVEGEQRVAPRFVVADVEVTHRAEEAVEQVQPMDPQIAKWIGTLTKGGRQRATRIVRIIRSPDEVNSHYFTAGTRPHKVHGPHHDRIEEVGVVY